MFAGQIDTGTLRQGDIIRDIAFPLPRVGEVLFLGTEKQGAGSDVSFEAVSQRIGTSKTAWFTGQLDVAVGFCVVLNQCCDVDAHQRHPPPSFTLCKLLPVPDGIKKNSDAYNTLRANVDPYGDQRPFFPLFYIGFHALLGDEYLVDYAQAMSVRWSDYSKVLTRKVLQLEDIDRAKFRVKAGAFFGRATPEELAAGTAYPWKTGPGQPTGSISLSQRLARAYRALRGLP